MNKVVNTAAEVIQGIKEDMVLMVGGFGLSGIQKTLLLRWSKTASKD